MNHFRILSTLLKKTSLFTIVLSMLLSSFTIGWTQPGSSAWSAANNTATRIPVRWFIGLGTGSDPGQVTTEQAVVDDYNNSQDKIQLSMEVVPNATALTTLITEIDAGNSPDIVGPVGVTGSNAFYGQWLDIKPLITKYHFDTSIFDPALLKMYETESGQQLGLPFAVYPSALIYNTALFTKAGLAYPPANYGDKYRMPNGTMVDWSWDTVKTVGQLLTLDSNGKNATQAGFDKTKIVQYGYTWNFESTPAYWGSYWQSGSMWSNPTAAPGTWKALAPAAWKAAWNWTYTGIWGDQPFIGSAAVYGSPSYKSGNPFDSGKVAMLDQPSWYTCCMNDVKTWDFGTMPSYNGKVAGRVDADTFRIPLASKHPDEAFQAMAYLETTGVNKLIVGSTGNPPAYGAIPAITAKQAAWKTAAQNNFPWVNNLNTLIAGLKYPDVPSAEAFVPNFNEAWSRQNDFGNLLTSTANLNLAAQITTLESDLTTLFNKTPPAASTLVSPLATVTTTHTPTYVWSKIWNSAYYRLWIKNSGGTWIVQKLYYGTNICGATNCAVTLPTSLVNGTYTWYIQTLTATQNGAWSTHSFTVAVPVPGAVTLVAPKGTTHIAKPTFIWSKDSVATLYRLWIKNSSGTWVIQNLYAGKNICGVTNCAIVSPVTLTNGTYTWYIDTLTAIQNGQWSAQAITVSVPDVLPAPSSNDGGVKQ